MRTDIERTSNTGTFSYSTTARTKLTSMRRNRNKENTIERTNSKEKGIKIAIDPAIETTTEVTSNGKVTQVSFAEALADVTQFF